MPRGSNFQKPYPPDFRREAAALYRRSGRPLREIASDLGVSTETLRVRTRQAAIDGGVSFDIARDVVDPNAIVALEVFEDAAARERQESLPEVGRVMSLLREILAAPPEATAFEVSSSVDAFAAA